jgi:hypothetical protein
MTPCRLNDPAVLAAWLDGTLDDEIARDVRTHLDADCPVCRGVLRFVDRLRVLVGTASDRAADERPAAARILLDSAALRRVMGLPATGATSREIHVEVGPWEARLRLRETVGGARRLQLRVHARVDHAPPREPLEVEVRRGGVSLASGRTDPGGLVDVPLGGTGALHVAIRGSGVAPPPVRIPL